MGNEIFETENYQSNIQRAATHTSGYIFQVLVYTYMFLILVQQKVMAIMCA